MMGWVDRLPWRRLQAAGILGINRRNADFVHVNPRDRFPLVDDKLATKRLAAEAGIPTPELQGVIEIERQVASLPSLVAQCRDFVVKPAHGSGGDGVVVIAERLPHGYRKVSGGVVSEVTLQHHVSNILGGLHSLGGLPDSAMIESRVQSHSIFATLCEGGVPDIRVVVYLGMPVMAMLRVPTAQSDGKANLHQGALGIGLNLATGITRHGVAGNRPVERHPDSGVALAGLPLPYWREILIIAARCFDLTGMGYIGVDIVLDRRLGPLLLEINARPGLNIQLANGLGLVPVLERARAKAPELQRLDAQQRVALATQLD